MFTDRTSRSRNEGKSARFELNFSATFFATYLTSFFLRDVVFQADVQGLWRVGMPGVQATDCGGDAETAMAGNSQHVCGRAAEGG